MQTSRSPPCSQIIILSRKANTPRGTHENEANPMAQYMYFIADSVVHFGQDQEWVGPTSEGQHRWDDFERKHERQDWGGMDMYGGKMMGILGRMMLRMELPGKRKGEGQKRGLWMWSKRTWLRLKWRRSIQKIGTTGDGKYAVAIPKGKSRKGKNKLYNAFIV